MYCIVLYGKRIALLSCLVMALYVVVFVFVVFFVFVCVCVFVFVVVCVFVLVCAGCRLPFVVV